MNVRKVYDFFKQMEQILERGDLKNPNAFTHSACQPLLSSDLSNNVFLWIKRFNGAVVSGH